jgi:hypothetical protein
MAMQQPQPYPWAYTRQRLSEGILDQVANIWTRNQPPARRAPTTAEAMPAARARPENPMAGMRGRQTRRETIEACRKMRQADTRAEALIGGLSRDAVRGGLRVSVTGAPDDAAITTAQQIADDLLARLRVNERLDDWLRLVFDDGDLFLEHSIVLDGGRPLIAEVTRKPTLSTHRASDESDRFSDPARAFWCGESWDGKPQKDAIWFAQWQVTHARWSHDEGQRYGRPLFASAVDSHKRVKEGEFDIAVRRKTRAGMRYIHKLIGATPDQVEEYKRINRDSLDDPYASLADFFLNFEGGIEVVQGDANLNEIADVLHHIRSWALASPLPLALLGYGENINRDVLKEQQQQYQRALEEVTAWAAGAFIKPLVELQWLLLGIWPGSLTYAVSQVTTEIITADTIRMAAEAAIKLRAARLPEPMIWPLIARLIPGLDVAAVLDAIEATASDPATRLAADAAGAAQ